MAVAYSCIVCESGKEPVLATAPHPDVTGTELLLVPELHLVSMTKRFLF